MKRLYPLLPYVLISGGIQIAIALWVPVDLTIHQAYLEVNLVENIQPRALVGTISHYLSPSENQFLIVTQIALFTWLFTVALLIATPREKRVPDPPDWQKCGLIFLFTFSTLPFITNAFSGFVDIFAAVTLILCVWLLYQRDPSSPLALVGVVLLMCIAMLIHEKSVFEALILLMWIAFTRRRQHAVSTIAAYALFLAGYLWLTSGKETGGDDMTVGEYLSLVAEFQSFLKVNSFNIIGIVFGGGLLWALYAKLAVVFVRVRQARDNPFPSSILVVGMLGLCFAPLLVAWDTNRLVAIIWLPTLLLLLELDCQAHCERTRIKAASLFAACLLQALIPPVLIYQHGAIALNCWASFVVQHLERAQEPDFNDWPLPLTLRLRRGRSDVSELYGCAPIHLTRP